LECGLDKQAIAILMDLLDSGIDPESLADGLHLLFFPLSLLHSYSGTEIIFPAESNVKRLSWKEKLSEG
jgi:hypothetical protein